MEIEFTGVGGIWEALMQLLRYPAAAVQLDALTGLVALARPSRTEAQPWPTATAATWVPRPFPVSILHGYYAAWDLCQRDKIPAVSASGANGWRFQQALKYWRQTFPVSRCNPKDWVC